jgi:hypothetical protein
MTTPTWKTERRPLASLRPFEHNPRRIMEKPLADLTKSMAKFGLAEPLVIQPDGLLIGGHARYQVLLAQGATEADCYVPDRALSEKDMIELNVRLNKNVAGEFDFDALANLPDVDIADLTAWGFQNWELGMGGTANDPNSEWQGMPDYVQNEIEGAALICIVKFTTENDRLLFEKLLGFKLQHKGKTFSCWWPEKQFNQLNKGKAFTSEP